VAEVLGAKNCDTPLSFIFNLMPLFAHRPRHFIFQIRRQKSNKQLGCRRGTSWDVAAREIMEDISGGEEGFKVGVIT